MESVSRHLGDYMLDNPSIDACCVFIATFLHLNVISDFRMRLCGIYYSQDKNQKIKGMQMPPLETDLLILILQKKISYTSLYKIFCDMKESTLEPKQWYKKLKTAVMNIPC